MGRERLTVNWQGPGFDKTPVSEAELFRVGAVAAPVNQGPAAADDAVTIRQDQSVIIAVLANDSSPRGDALTIIAASNPAHGSVLAMGGTILYKPESGFVGKDGFVYTITDGYGLQATANVSVLVEASFTVPFSGNDYRLTAEKLVSQYYLDILKRQPSDEEVAFWVEQLNGGTLTRAEIIDRFLSSPEVGANIAPIVRLYFACFLRIPDYNGLNFWINEYKSGLTIEGIAEGFVRSPEFTSIYGVMSNEEFVTLLYNNVLDRAPDQNGFVFWVSKLNKGELTRGQVVAGFSNAIEYIANSARQVYIILIHMGLLDRVPGQAEMAGMMESFTQGASGIELIDQVLASAAYRERFGDRLLTLQWSPSSSGAPEGYKIFTGPTPDGAIIEVADIAVDQLADPSAPSTDFLTYTELGLNSGETVCFRIKAYDVSASTPYSDAACTGI